MIKRMTFAAVIALAFGTVLVENTIASTSTNEVGCYASYLVLPIDLSLMKTNHVDQGCSVTNLTRLWLAVDVVVDQLRDQGILVDLIKKMIVSGDVCAVAGHKWENLPHVTLEYRPDGNYPSHRTCALCGKKETKEPGVWK